MKKKSILFRSLIALLLAGIVAVPFPAFAEADTGVDDVTQEAETVSEPEDIVISVEEEPVPGEERQEATEETTETLPGEDIVPDVPEEAMPEESAPAEDPSEPDEIISADVEENPEETESSETVFDDDVVLFENLVVEEGERVVFRKAVTIPFGVTLRNNGELIFQGKVLVNGKLENRDGAVITVEESAVLYFGVEQENTANQAELINLGNIYIYGAAEFAKGTTFASTNNPLLCKGEGAVRGTLHYLDRNGKAPEETIILSSQKFLELSRNEGFQEDETYTLSESVVVSESDIVTITAGNIIIPEGVTLTNSGALFISGGELVLEDGAQLKNNLFISVEKKGRLVLAEKAKFVPGEHSAIVWDQTQERDTSLISGIERKWIDAAVFATSQGEFNQMIHSTGYCTLMIYVENAGVICNTESLSQSIAIFLK